MKYHSLVYNVICFYIKQNYKINLKKNLNLVKLFNIKHKPKINDKSSPPEINKIITICSLPIKNYIN